MPVADVMLYRFSSASFAVGRIPLQAIYKVSEKDILTELKKFYEAASGHEVSLEIIATRQLLSALEKGITVSRDLMDKWVPALQQRQRLLEASNRLFPLVHFFSPSLYDSFARYSLLVKHKIAAPCLSFILHDLYCEAEGQAAVLDGNSIHVQCILHKESARLAPRPPCVLNLFHHRFPEKISDSMQCMNGFHAIFVSCSYYQGQCTNV